MKSKVTLVATIALLVIGGLGFWFVRDWKTGGGLLGGIPAAAPADWPKDIPFPSDGKLFKKTGYDSGMRYDISVPTDIAETIKFYETGMKAQGWSLDPTTQAGSQMWSKEPNRLVQISAAKEQGTTYATVLILNRGGEVGGLTHKLPTKPFPGDIGETDGADGKDNLPASIPRFGGLTFTKKEMTETSNLKFDYTSSATVREIADFYQKTMKEQGWEALYATSFGEGPKFRYQETFKKGDITVSIRAVPEVAPATLRTVSYILYPKTAAVPQVEVFKKEDVFGKNPTGQPTPDQPKPEGEKPKEEKKEEPKKN